MRDSKSSYQQIIRATSIFGSVQVFNVIVAIVRAKLIAIFIGPAGMGIAALLNATINIISGICSMGIEVSAVKHISSHYKDEDLDAISGPASVVKRIALITGIAGTILTIALANWLSRLTFGNSAHTMAFVLLSITLLLKQLSTGELVILQGMRKIKLLAKANFYGNLAGLVFSVPLYYFYRIDAIVPTIIVSTFCAMVFSFFYSNKVRINKVALSNKEAFKEGKSMIKLGMVLTFSSVLTLVSSYLIQIYLGNTAGIEMVGFYNAAFTLLNSYVGLLFVAMSTDYFPRLSANIDDAPKIRQAVIEQSSIGILIITPIIILFLAFSETIVHLLFSKDFLVIIPMIAIGIVGMLFRVVSFSLGYMILAKADTKLFIKNTIGFNILYLALSIGGYYYYGLAGLGAAFTAHYFFHFIIIKTISFYKYNFTFDKMFVKIFVICMGLCILAFLRVFIENSLLKFAFSLAMIVVSCIFCLYEINKRTDIMAFVRRLKNK